MRRKITSVILTVIMCLTIGVFSGIAASAAELPFVDVPQSQWYYSWVKGAYDLGLINGKDAAHYEPDSNMTYAEAIKLAACMNQKYDTGSVTLTVGTDNWYDTYVDYCIGKGIISYNYASMINSKIDRQTYAFIFASCLPKEALPAVNSVSDGTVPDVSKNNPYHEQIYTLYRAGIIKGNDEKGTFNPTDKIKRSEVAAILNRMMDKKVRVGAPDNLRKPDLSDIQVGDEITFGLYYNEPIRWKVLDKRNDELLVISKYALARQGYNNTEDWVAWESCSLRTWLNSNFYNMAFSDKEKSVIELSIVTADKDPRYPDSDYGFNTLDHVFALSTLEADKYLKTKEDRIGITSAGRLQIWWLRSGAYDNRPPYLSYNDGSIWFNNKPDAASSYTRPSMWIKANF